MRARWTSIIAAAALLLPSLSAQENPTAPQAAAGDWPVPITSLGKDGKQSVAIVAAGRSALDNDYPEGTDALVVFALP